ncbi:MAG TPA: mechanosensitive ion channel [Hellea balneolensis]|uniref:Small-conductance mechanosensitive channel n=1 Tax=Hellea balneolensis TaxID=287478 RepID=A0A7C5QZK6_9PROT|nr:mechanosensitive ion channel [Hellea balneolensis]
MDEKAKIADLAKDVSWESLNPYIMNIFSALGVLILGWLFARWLERFTRTRLSNNKGLEASPTLTPLIATIIRYAVLLTTIFAALTIAGFPPTSLLAVFGAAGLAIALAVQGTLSNVAAGIMLVFLRSIKVGEYIETPNVQGTVLEIGLFTTQMKTSDGVFVTVPNAQIWASQIHNYSRFRIRRIDINIDLARDNDLEAAIALLDKVTTKESRIMNKAATSVVITGFGPTTASLQIRCWLKADNLRTDSSDLRVLLHQALLNEGFKLPPALPLN